MSAGSGGSKVLATIDLLIKLIATGALVGILVVLVMLHNGVARTLDGERTLRVAVSAINEFSVAATVRNDFSPFRMKIVD